MFDKILRSVLYPRGYAMPARDPGAGVSGLEKMTVDTAQGEVEGWFLPRTTDGPPGPGVIFAHGNAELIDHWPEFMQPYREMGVSVLLAEYRGYGRSAGDPTQERITADFVAFRSWLDARDEVDPQRVIYHGRSLGGGAVGALAARVPPAALILESTFTSVADIASAFMVPRGFIADPYDTIGTIAANPGLPLLVMHGDHDSLVRPEHGRKLASASEASRLEWFDADHNDFPGDVDRYWSVVKEFVTDI